MEQFILRVCEAENKLQLVYLFSFFVEISFALSSLESFTGIFIFCLHPYVFHILQGQLLSLPFDPS